VAAQARRARRRLALLVAAAALWPGRANAEDEKPDVSFSADQVEGDARMRELVLRGNVVVTYERFRLTSPQLSLRRSGRGVEVTGPGEVVFCPCPNPPVSIGFEGGVVAPPADLMLTRPSLRVAGWTIFALPWFWMRAPSRPGVLPPNVAYRGNDGLLIGDGVHLPWKDGDDFNQLDITASGYIKGGFELVTRFWTPRSTNRIRWDRLETDHVAVQAHGAYPQAETGALAWDIDAVRGARARSASLTLEEAARGYDRASVQAMVRPANGIILSSGVRGIGARGGIGPSERPAWGPTATLAMGGAMGAFGAWDGLATATVLNDAVLGPTTLSRAEGGIELSARASAILARLSVREAITAADAGRTSSLDALGAARIEVAAPLARVFADETSPLVHVIEPRLRASAMAARTSGTYFAQTGRPLALMTGQMATASAGLRTAWGRLLGHAGASLEADLGGVGVLDDAGLSRTTPIGRGRAAWTSRWFAVGGEAAARLARDDGHVLIGKARLGEKDGWHLAVKAAGRRGFDPLAARALTGGTAEEPSGGWLAAEGWSGGAEIAARLARSVGARISAEEDFTSRTLLQVRGSLGYAHPCRCIAVDGFVGKRLGREGVDVWVSIDLAPR
jgi:hypothetical protein